MNTEKTVEMLSALANTTRLNVFKILMAKGKEGLPAGQIAEKLNIPQNSLSSHLKVLSYSGLVKSTRQGRNLIYAVQLEETKELISVLVNDCCNGHPEICSLAIETGCS